MSPSVNIYLLQAEHDRTRGNTDCLNGFQLEPFL